MIIEIEDTSMAIRPENAADRAYLQRLGAREEGDTIVLVRQDKVVGYGKNEKFHIRIDFDNKDAGRNE